MPRRARTWTVMEGADIDHQYGSAPCGRGDREGHSRWVYVIASTLAFRRLGSCGCCRIQHLWGHSVEGSPEPARVSTWRISHQATVRRRGSGPARQVEVTPSGGQSFTGTRPAASDQVRPVTTARDLGRRSGHHGHGGRLVRLLHVRRSATGLEVAGQVVDRQVASGQHGIPPAPSRGWPHRPPRARARGWTAAGPRPAGRRPGSRVARPGTSEATALAPDLPAPDRPAPEHDAVHCRDVPVDAAHHPAWRRRQRRVGVRRHHRVALDVDDPAGRGRPPARPRACCRAAPCRRRHRGTA